MAQFARPASDVSTGSWTTTPLWSKIDEGSPGDGTRIKSDDNTSPDNADFTTTSVSDPQSSTGHILRAAWNKSASGGHSINAVLELWQGVPGTGTLIATLSVTDIGATEQEDTYTLSAAEADSITDYSALHLRLSRQGDTGGPPNGRHSLVVNFAELEVPDATVNSDVSLAATFPAFTGNADASVALEVSTAATLPALTASASSAVLVQADAAGTFPLLQASADVTAIEERIVSLAATFPALTGAADVALPVQGDLLSVFPMLQGNVSAQVAVALDAAATFPLLTASAAAAVTVQTDLSATFPLLQASASVSALDTRQVDLAATFPALSAAITAEALLPVDVAASLPVPTATASATVRVQASAAGTFPLPQLSAGLTNSAPGAPIGGLVGWQRRRRRR